MGEGLGGINVQGTAENSSKKQAIDSKPLFGFICVQLRTVYQIQASLFTPLYILRNAFANLYLKKWYSHYIICSFLYTRKLILICKTIIDYVMMS